MERKKNMTQWERNAIEARDTYGAHVDWEERFYECSECGGQMPLKTISQTFSVSGKEIEIRGIEAYVCDECGEVVYTSAEAKMIERVLDAINESRQEDEDWEDDVDETGFDPYMGCYSDDC